MADLIIQDTTLQAIADAIRAKTGGSEALTPSQMASEVTDKLSAGGAGGGDIDALIDGSITEIESGATTTRDYAFYFNRTLKTVSFPNATNIGGSAFYSCSALTSVNFPKLRSLTSSAFYSCSSLTRVVFPNVTYVPPASFFGCSRLISAIFPKVANIGGDNSFGNCYSITKLLVGTESTTVCTLGSEYAFDTCYHIKGITNATYNPNGLQDGYIYVPNALVASYRTATNWNWGSITSQIMPWVATTEELANIDTTLYDKACVGYENDGIEYSYDGTQWTEVIR